MMALKPLPTNQGMKAQDTSLYGSLLHIILGLHSVSIFAKYVQCTCEVFKTL